MRAVIGAGILLVAFGLLSVGAGHGIAFGQGGGPGGGMMGMMGGMTMMGGPFPPTARPLAMDQAVQLLRQWPAAHGVAGVALDEVEAYTENYFGLFKEVGTGRGAFTLVVDRYTGRVMPEMGGNMMWNTKYGTMGGMGAMGGTGMMGGMMMNNMMGGGMMNGGMMGGGTTTPRAATSPASPLSEAQARQRADQFLSGYLPGARAGDGDSFYGYYHLDVVRGIHQVGMLDVNAETGQVWYHTWHGEFLQSRELTQ